MNFPSRAEIETLVQQVEKIEAAVEPRFQEHFVDAMAFPHKTATFTELGKAVTLPQPVITSTDPASVRRGRNARRRARKDT